MGLIDLQIPAPDQGVFKLFNPRKIPDDGAAVLEDLRVDGGLARSRDGSTQVRDDPDNNRVIDVLSLKFKDDTAESLRCVKDGTRNASNTAWTPITLDVAWTGSDLDRFWAVVSPWSAENKGRIILGNGIDTIKSWTGSGTMGAVLGAQPARYGIIGDDARLFILSTIEGGANRFQRVRWSVVGLLAGTADDWDGTDQGSGFIDLDNDTWQITGVFKQAGQIFVGKEQGMCVLRPTGIPTNAYGYEALTSGGDGIWAARSLVGYGNANAFISHRDVILFANGTFTPVGGRVRRDLYRRINKNALNQVTSVFDARENRIGWGLPLDGSETPTEIWWLFPDTGKWEIDKIQHTTLGLFLSTTITTFDDLLGDFDSLGGTFDQLSPSSAPDPVVVYGKEDGKVLQFDPGAKDDAGSAIMGVYVSPAKQFIGQELLVGGRPRRITESDEIISDRVSVGLLDIGDTYTVEVSVSGNGGSTFTVLGNLTVTTAGGTIGTPRIVNQQIHKRTAVGDAVSVRLRVLTTNVRWGWVDTTPHVDTVGRKL